jgi:hypothetical protein
MVASLQVIRRRKGKLPDGKLRGPTRVKVGFPRSKSKQANVLKAVVNEFGTRHIPERPFMRNTMRNNIRKYRGVMRDTAAKLLRGEMSLGDFMNKLGALVQGDMQHEITALTSPPNAPSTIKQKGSSKPLIDTGEMRQAVTWEMAP